jgi:hypothetical protein
VAWEQPPPPETLIFFIIEVIINSYVEKLGVRQERMALTGKKFSETVKNRVKRPGIIILTHSPRIDKF